MSEQENQEQQKKILAVLVVILVAFGVWRLVVPAVSSWIEGLSTTQETSRRIAQTAQITSQKIEHVRLEDLQSETATYSPKRNIFRYAPKPLPPPPPPPPPVAYSPPPPPPPREPPPPAVPQPPSVDFTVLGLFGPESRRIAVLIDGEDLINALERDVVKEEFVIDRIGYQTVSIAFVDFPDAEPVVLEIVGKEGGVRGGGGGNTSRRRGRGRGR